MKPSRTRWPLRPARCRAVIAPRWPSPPLSCPRPGDLEPAIVAELRRHFSPAEQLELTLDVMEWSYQKVIVALGIDDEVRPGQLTDLAFDADGNAVRPG